MDYFKKKQSSIKDLLCEAVSAPAQRVRLCAALALALSVSFCYLKILVPAEKEFLFFQAGHYSNFRLFFANFTYWFASAVLSSLYFFLCKHRWNVCLGILSLNYWWISLCTIGWGAGLIQNGGQLYMLPVAISSYYCLYRYRARWRKKTYGEEKNRWSGKDYFIGVLVLFAAALTHICLLFPKAQNFYIFHSGWFRNVQNFVYFFGLFLSNIIWLALWLFDRGNEWLYPYITWPLTMFIFRFSAMLTAETKAATVEQNYCFLLPMAMLLGFFLCRMRKSLYIRTHRREIKRIMAPGIVTRKLQREVAVLIRWAKRKLLINCENISFWKDLVMGIALAAVWLTGRSEAVSLISSQITLNDWIYSRFSDISLVSNIIFDVVFIMALSLWWVFCSWLYMRPCIAMALTICCFAMVERLGANPLEDSGYYILIVGIIAGAQLWREREYFLCEAFCHEEQEREDYMRQCNLIKARERLFLKEYERKKQLVRKRFEKIGEGREQERRRILEVASTDEVFWCWRRYMKRMHDREEQRIIAYDEKLSEKYHKRLEHLRKMKEKLNKRYKLGLRSFGENLVVPL